MASSFSDNFRVKRSAGYCLGAGMVRSSIRVDILVQQVSVSKTTLGMFARVTAKFNRFCSRAISASLRDLEDKLITQLL